MHDGILHPATELARTQLPDTLEEWLELLRSLATVKDFRIMRQSQISSPFSQFSRTEASVLDLYRALDAQLNEPRWADTKKPDVS